MKYILVSLVAVGLMLGIVTTSAGDSNKCKGTGVSSCSKVTSTETCSNYYNTSSYYCDGTEEEVCNPPGQCSTVCTGTVLNGKYCGINIYNQCTNYGDYCKW